jgi:hypothetical protein
LHGSISPMRLHSSAEILGLPTRLPVGPEPRAMPADDRLRPQNCNRAEDGGEPAEPNQQKAIGIAELWSLRYLAAKHVELLAKDSRTSAASFALGLKIEAAM